VIDSIVARYGVINGIIHSAGIISDKYIIRKTVEDFKEVIAPKISGVSNLDEATRNIQLDWMVFFSSIAGAFGNAGQVDYALGNCYMDYFSYYRNQQVAKGERTGKTVSINWPLWKEGGMSVSEDLEKIIYDKTGMLPLPVSSGLIQFLQSLSLPGDRMISLYGNTDRIRKGLKLSHETRLTTIPKIKTESSVVADEVFTGYGLKYLQRLISSFLEMTTVVDPDTNFETYGMDSVMIMQVTGKLEGVFGQLPKTLFFECVSLRSLNEYFVRNHPKRFREILELPEATQGSETITSDNKKAFLLPANGFDSFHEKKTTSRFVSQTSKEPEKNFNHEKVAGMEDIAVIALAGKFPEADNIDEFWQNLKSGKNCVTRVPVNRWKDESSLGGFINNVDAFDPHFFHVSPIEAEVMDPQTRLFLENTWNLLENGAYSSERIKNTTNGSVGVFVGVMSNQYPFIQSSDKMINAVRTTAAFHAISNRTSYFFDFKGPSFTLDSACSSGLTAIHLACKSLLNEECKMAIAGGVNLSIHPDKFTGLKKLGFIGSDDNSRSFGDGDGYLPSEGVGAILLKKLSDAEKDNDQILAVIKSSHINHAGRSTGYSVPNPNQQAQLIEENFKRARISPETISYAELAVNGSMLGDAIELAGISSVFKKATPKEHFCAIV
jgi:3-oxoacyl-(acyl-carrier-protein) synthase